MNNTDPMSADDIQKFVDGRLSPEDQMRMEAWLAEHPEDATLVHAYRLQNANLSRAYDGVLDEPVPKALEDIVTMRAARSSRPSRPAIAGWMRIAATIVIFALGGGAGWLAHGLSFAPQPAGFAANAMGAHKIFVAERRHPVEVPSNQEAHLFKWLSKRLGVTLKAPNLASAGFRLMGGRLLADGPLPAAQFMYENAQKKRMTVYVRAAANKGKNTAFRFEDDNGTGAFYWVDANYAYALVAPMGRAPLLDIANRVYRELNP